MKGNKTYLPSPSENKSQWRLIDAKGKVLGRLASEIAMILQGKDKPIYTPHLLTGDYVVVINAEQIKVTGNKLKQKIYKTHSGYIGHQRQTPLDVMLEKHPERVLQKAVKGMLPNSSLGRRMLERLKLYAGDAHPHQAQLGAKD